MGPTPKPGEENPDLINSGGGYITAVPGAYACSSLASFEIIRGGHVDVTFLGALEVDEHGDLANWIICQLDHPRQEGARNGRSHGPLSGCPQGHPDHGAHRQGQSQDSQEMPSAPYRRTAKGNPKILKKCRLPLTAAGQVNMIITEMGVMDITDKGIVLREIHPEFTVEQVQAATEAQLIIDPDLKPMRQ